MAEKYLYFEKPWAFYPANCFIIDGAIVVVDPKKPKT